MMLLIAGTVAIGQTRLSQTENIGWYAVYFNSPTVGKISGTAEYQFRRVDWAESWQQSLLRAGLNYKFNAQASAQFGLAWVLTYPYGEYSLAATPKTYPEMRIHEQLTLSSAIGKINFSNRIRLEQRWIGKLKTMASDGPDEWIYLNRLRDLVRFEVPVTKKLYTGVFDEIFIGFGKNIGENVFDQNRVCLFLGYKFTSQWKLEGGYFSQTVQLGREIQSKNVFQYNTGFLIASTFQFK